MADEWVKTPFEALEEAHEWAANQDLLIEPVSKPGLRAFRCVDVETETLVAQRDEGGPVLSMTRPRAKREPIPVADRILKFGEDAPWKWSPALSSLAAVEKLWDGKDPVLKGDYIAYRHGVFVHEYLIDAGDQVYQRLAIYKEV